MFSVEKVLKQTLKCFRRVQAQQSYESQIISLKSTVSNLDADLERIKTDRLSLQEDLHSARDMNVKLDGSKEQISRQLAAKSLENDQVRF